MSSIPTSFSQFSLHPSVFQGLETLGFDTPTPVQAAAIPQILQGVDAIFQAKTGSGKTLAFGLPLLTMIEPQGFPQALVVLPTRELALQVAEAIQKVSTRLQTVALFGGVKLEPQEKALAEGVDLVIATPGRLKDLVMRGSLDLSRVRVLVLDEADEMLDMGFRRDIEWMLNRLPNRKQTLILSATMPPEIEQIARTHLANPAVVKLTHDPVPTEISHFFVRLKPEQRVEGLIALLQQENPERALIFTRMKHETRALARKLEKQAGIVAGFLNGNMSQNARNRMMERFRAGEFRFLIATDVAARGLDIEGVTHVFHFAIPTVPETYIHRSGRTGRAGKCGRAIALLTPEAEPDFHPIQKRLNPTELTLNLMKKPESWRRYKLVLRPEHRQTQESFQKWLSDRTGLDRQCIRMVALMPDHALVEVESRHQERFRAGLKL